MKNTTACRRMRAIIAAAAMGALTLTGCSSSSAGSGSGDEVVEWDYLQFVGLNHPMAVLAQKFADDVEKETNGKLKINLVGPGELPYTQDEHTRRTGEGAVEMANSLGVFVSGDCTPIRIPALPFLIDSYEEWDTAWPVLEDSIEKECFENYGTKLLYDQKWVLPTLFGQGEAVSSTSQLAGKSIRQNSPEEGAVLTSLGASTETIASAEVPTALERGVVDIVATSHHTADSAGWWEYLDWGFDFKSGGISVGYIVVNQDAYGSLPDDVREGLDRAVDAAAERDAKQVPIDDEAARQRLVDNGIVFNEVSEADLEAAKEVGFTVQDDWMKQNPDSAELVEQVRRTLGKN